MVNSVDLPDEIKSVKSKYRVIFHVNNPDLRTKISELSFIFDYWNLLEKNRDDIVLDKKIRFCDGWFCIYPIEPKTFNETTLSIVAERTCDS
jgi:hypothetical protein